MYLARKTIHRKTHYYIRTTYQDQAHLKSKDVFDLGTDPSKYIIYPGGNAYYFDPIIEETLHRQEVDFLQEDMDTIFWEFLDPEIQRVIKGFQRNTRKQESSQNHSDTPVHIFDKRRWHYLRFASPDQRRLNSLPSKFFKHFRGKSRDEIEQYFIAQERILNPREVKTYVYTIFDLQRFFYHPPPAHTMQSQNQSRMDTFFIDAICQLNDDACFWAGMDASENIHDYLIKYIIMYFDYDLPSQSPFQDYLNAFRNRHRAYTPPQKVRVKIEEASRIFETSWQQLKEMDLRAFNQLYRKLALKHHPDRGGESETFIQLKEFYETLSRKKK